MAGLRADQDRVRAGRAGRSEHGGEQTEQRAPTEDRPHAPGRAAGGGYGHRAIMPAARGVRHGRGSPHAAAGADLALPGQQPDQPRLHHRQGVHGHPARASTTPCRMSRALIEAKQTTSVITTGAKHAGVLGVAGGDQQTHRERDVECRHLPARVRLVARRRRAGRAPRA